MKFVVKTENVEKTYMQGKIPVHALRGIDFSVEEGEYVAILGPSGSGKSTLLNLIGALDVPTKGKVFISGQDISELNSRKRAELRRTIGFVFQFYNLIPRISAFKNVELSLSVKNISRSERKKIVKKILTDVGLQDRMKHAPNELSGGQQQRVAIARALALDPTYLLMDEPTGNVDTKTRDMIMKLINQLNKEKDRTIIMITHDQFIAKDSDRIEYLVDGKLYHKPPKERIGYNTNSLKKQKLNDNKIIASEEKS